jgi:hypothetical protein
MEVVKRICDLCGADIQHKEDVPCCYDMAHISIRYDGNTQYTDMCAECYKVVLPKVKAILKDHNTVGQL